MIRNGEYVRDPIHFAMLERLQASTRACSRVRPLLARHVNGRAYQPVRSRSACVRALCSAAAPADAPPSVEAPVRHFFNLSNGVEALGPMLDAGLRPESVLFCRLQSSRLEAHDYEGVLTNLDHNLLTHLALGFECRVYDFGSRGPEPFVPRAIWYGLEWSRYALSRLWKLPPFVPVLRGRNATKHFQTQFCRLSKKEQKRLKYYREYVPRELTELRLHGYYARTHIDGQKLLYRDMLHSFVEASMSMQKVRGAPTPTPAGLELYLPRLASPAHDPKTPVSWGPPSEEEADEWVEEEFSETVDGQVLGETKT